MRVGTDTPTLNSQRNAKVRKLQSAMEKGKSQKTDAACLRDVLESHKGQGGELTPS